MNEEKAKRERTAQYYAVAFIDLLGQRAELRKFGDLPDQRDENAMKEFMALYSRTVRRVDVFHTAFKKFFEGFQQISLPEMLRTQYEEKFGAQIAPPKIGYKRFWDGIQIFVSMNEDENQLTAVGVWALLGACSGVFLVELSMGQPLRGGIDIGIGIELEENELYGNAVLKAYELENYTAKYPRIVIGDELMNYLRAKASATEPSSYTVLQRQFAERCFGLITADTDGIQVLDYLSEDARKLLAVGDSTIEKPTEDAYRYVLSALKKWGEERDSKLAFRYKLLKDYFDFRLGRGSTLDSPRP